MAVRDTFCYVLRKNQQIVHVGITTDPVRREQEHQRNFGPMARLEIIGQGAYTCEVAKAWEDDQRTLGYPTGP